MKNAIILAFLLAALLVSATAIPVYQETLEDTSDYDIEGAGNDVVSHVRIGETDLSFEMDHPADDDEEIIPSVRDTPRERQDFKYEPTRAPYRTYEGSGMKRSSSTTMTKREEARRTDEGSNGRRESRGTDKENSKTKLVDEGEEKRKTKRARKVKHEKAGTGSGKAKKRKGKDNRKVKRRGNDEREKKNKRSGDRLGRGKVRGKSKAKSKEYSKGYSEGKSRGTGKSTGGGKIGGQSDAYPPMCQCRALRSDKNAICYDMIKPGQSYGRCKKRTCGTKYECVPGGGKGLKTCIRRVARFETKLRRDEKGVALCNKFKMKKSKVFYTLYH